MPKFTVHIGLLPEKWKPTTELSTYREFIKLHRLSTFNLDDFQKQIRDSVNRYVKDAVANAPAAHNIPVVQIESKRHKSMISWNMISAKD